jgi:hypothetical protein
MQGLPDDRTGDDWIAVAISPIVLIGAQSAAISHMYIRGDPRLVGLKE